MGPYLSGGLASTSFPELDRLKMACFLASAPGWIALCGRVNLPGLLSQSKIHKFGTRSLILRIVTGLSMSTMRAINCRRREPNVARNRVLMLRNLEVLSSEGTCLL